MEDRTKYFEITDAPADPDSGYFHIEDSCGDLWFRPADIDSAEAGKLSDEAGKWELVDSYRSVYEDLAYDDRSVSEGERVITDDLLVSLLQASLSSNQVRGGYLIKNGSFAGYVLSTENTSSFGMSVNKDSGLGALLIDGRSFGRTSYHYFHSSTELSESSSSDYSLRLKNS